MEFLCLGPVEARADGTPLDLGEPQRRLVLALLLADANQVVSTDRLVDGVWGEEPPASGRKIVQGYVSGLRKALGDGDTIRSRNPGYVLEVERQQVDATRFEDLAAEGASLVGTDPQRARLVLGDALALWKGTPYQDLADSDALRPEIVRLEQLRLTALENHMAAGIFTGSASAVAGELGDLCARHPLRERLWTLQMLALYRSGRPTEALRAYDAARSRLAEDVGLEPSTELQTMRDRVLAGDPILDTNMALDPAGQQPPRATRNPYKGLRAFGEADADDFFGRDALVRRLSEVLDRRGRPRLVVLTGASGTGKSSAVRAGLIPRLRRDGWTVASMYPGVDPLGSWGGTLPGANDVAGSQSAIVVDQLEELFAMVGEPSVRARFLDAIVEAADPAQQGPWVVATIRADFLEELMGHRGFGELLDDGLMVVPPLDDHEIRDVVEKPAARVGVSVEPSLVAAIIHEAEHRPTALPLLQFTLTDLFDRRQGGSLTLDAYRAAGGITGALAERAEEVYLNSSDEERETTRQLMLRLVAHREGAEPTRRRVAVSSLVWLPQVDTILDRLAEHRLVTFDRGAGLEPTVEVAHEALLDEWPRLRAWIDDATIAIRAQTRLAEAAADWESADRSDAYLLAGARLARYSDWDETGIALADTERSFLEASLQHEADLRTRSRRRRRAVVAGFGVAALVAGVLAVAAMASARRADERAREARAEALAGSAIAIVDDDPELAVLLGIEALETDPDSPAAASALDGALQAHRTIYAVDRSATPPAIGSVSPDGELLAVVSGYQTLEVFTVGSDTPLWQRDAPEGREFEGATFTPDGKVLVPEFSPEADSPNGPTVAYTLHDGATGRVEHTVDVGEPCLLGQWTMGAANASTGFVDTDLPVFLMRLDTQPDGRCTPPAEGPDLVAFDIWSGDVTDVAKFGPLLTGVPTMSGDGSRLAFASGGPGAIAEVGAEEPIRELPRGMSTISDDGVFALVDTKPLQLIHVDSGDLVSAYPGDYARAYFAASGRFVIATGYDGATRVFDTRDARLLFELRGAGSRDLAVQTTSDERLAATFAGDGTARVWNIGSQLLGTASAATWESEDPDAFLPRASTVAAPPLAVVPIGNDGSRKTALFDLATWDTLRELPGRAVAISPDGSTIAMQSWPGPVDIEVEEGVTVSYNQVAGILLVDASTGAVVAELEEGPCLWHNRTEHELPGPGCSDYPEPWVEWATSGSFSADGSLFAMGGASGYAAVWDVATRERVHFFDTAGGGNRYPGTPTEVTVAFSPTREQLAVHQWSLGTHPALRKVDSETWAIDAEIVDLDQPITAMAYTPDGSTLLAVDAASDVIVIDVESWEVATLLEGQQGAQLNDVAVSPDGRHVAAGASDGTLWIWDLSSERVFRRIEFQATAAPLGLDGLVNVEYVDADTVLVSSEVSAVLMTLDPAVLLDFARTRITRTFTQQECATYEIDPCPSLTDLQDG